MVKVPQSKTHLLTRRSIERITHVGHITRQEHLNLTSLLLSNYKLTLEERRQINRIFDALKAGTLTFIE